MAQAAIPVDLFNPGQVFACVGFLEAAEVLLGGAVGGFAWSNESEPHFTLSASGDENPFRAVLEFLCGAQLKRLAPIGYVDPAATKKRRKVDKRPAYDEASNAAGDGPTCTVETFPAPRADRLALPLRLERNGRWLDVTHWCDGSSRESFKLFAGQQRSVAIAQQMIDALRELWEQHKDELVKDPFGLTVPLGGSSFKFDARKAWTAIDAGYSPDEQAHAVEASPVVEMLAAIGLEHARPEEFNTLQVRYCVWQGLLPPTLARPALGGSRVCARMRVFSFTLGFAGSNKVVTFAREEVNV